MKASGSEKKTARVLESKSKSPDLPDKESLVRKSPDKLGGKLGPEHKLDLSKVKDFE